MILALLISLFEAFLILPGHMISFLRIRPKSERREAREEKNLLLRWVARTSQLWDERIVPAYLRLLSTLLEHRKKVLGATAALFVATLILAGTAMRVVLFPPNGVEVFTIAVEAPLGTSLRQTLVLMGPIEEKLSRLPRAELQSYSALAGESSFDPLDWGFRSGAHYGLLTVYLTPAEARRRSADEIMEAVRKDVGSPQGLLRVTFIRPSGGPPVGKPVSLSVTAENYEQILPAAQPLKKELEAVRGVKDIADNFTLGKKELRVRVNGAEARAAGLSVASIGLAVRAGFEGLVATSIRQLDEEIDLRVHLQGDSREDAATLSKIRIPTPLGNLVPLSRVARIEEGQGIAVYDHKNNRRQVLVTADMDLKVTSAQQANAELAKRLPDFQKRFPVVKVEFGGEDEDTNEALKSLGRAFIIAFFAIFLILVLTFQNLLQPLLVLLTVPLGIISVLLAFFVHGWPTTFLGTMGIIALAGVIVNNDIVFVDFVNQERAQGADRFESIRRAAGMRIRPIFLTTITTVMGVLPTAYGIGGRDDFVVPLALALGWGLLFGSVLTAFVFPSALAVLEDFEAFVARHVGARRT